MNIIQYFVLMYLVNLVLFYLIFLSDEHLSTNMEKTMNCV